jgi:hypothetical protein
MQTGGQALVRVNRGSAGLIKHVYVLVQYTVANAQVQLLPMPWWFANGNGINVRKSTDTEPAQQLFSEALIIHLNTFANEKFKQLADKMQTKIDGYNTPYLQPGTYNAVLRLEGCWLEDVWIRDLNQDLNIELNFNPNGCLQAGTASNVTVNSVSIMLKQHELSEAKEREISSKFKSGVFKKNFISYNQFTVNQTITAGSQNTFQMSPIRNLNAFLFFGIRSSKASTGGAVKQFLKLGDNLNVGTFEELDSSGRSVTLLPIDAELALKENGFEYFDGELLRNNYNLYIIPHGHPDKAIHGDASGFQKYTSLEQLRLIPGATTSETARVVTILPESAGTATAATGGTYQLGYRKGDGTSYISGPIAYNASQSTVNTAIVTMQIPNISVAAGATNLNNTAGLTLTVTNQSLDGSDLAVNGAEWYVLNSSITNGTVNLTCNVADTTAGVVATGFTNGANSGSGTYYLDVFGAVLRTITIDNGDCTVTDYQPEQELGSFR